MPGTTPSARVPGLSRATLVDELARGIVAYIAQNGYAVADRLPAMTTLATHFGVSIPTLRETLRRLENNGLLRIRHGSGVYVAAETGRFVLPNLALAPISPETLLEVLDARAVIEPELAQRAAVRRTAEELAELDAFEAAGAAALERNDAGRLDELNVRFHLQVARISGNRVLADVLQTVIDVHRDHDGGARFAEAERDHRRHAGIRDAIAAGDGGAARALMHDHLLDVLGTARERTAATRTDPHGGGGA